MSHFTNHNVICNRQHGFRARHSCESHLLSLTQELHEYLEKKSQIDLIVLDFSNAFDKVPHQRLKPGVHTNDFAPIHRLRALKLGHASLATVFRPGRLTLQPILRENLESPVLRYQPITTAVVTDACLNTRWHHGAYTSAVLRESLGLDRVVTVYVELSRPDWLATVQSGRKQVQSRVCTPSFMGEDMEPGYPGDNAPVDQCFSVRPPSKSNC